MDDITPRATIGDNSIKAEDLQAYIERVERLEEERRAIAGDVKEVYAEAKSSGYDVKIMRKVVAERRRDADKRREERELFELYGAALHLFD